MPNVKSGIMITLYRLKRFFFQNRPLSVVIALFLLVNVYSFLPVLGLYFRRAPADIELNSHVVETLRQNNDPHFSFIVMSDTSSGCFVQESATLKLVSRMNREDRFKKCPIDFVMNVGDVTFRGKESHYRNYAKIRGRIKYPVMSAIGNHDDDLDNGESGEALFRKYCGEKEFSFTDRNAYFMVLDNKNGNFSEDQFEWLEGELRQAARYRHSFIFMHKPPFNPYQQSWYRIETCPWSHRFMKLCQEYGVSAVFAGHEYINRTFEFGDVRYVVSGGGGALLFEAPRRDNAFLHYMVVKVNGDYVDWETREVFPPVWEYFLLYMWKDLYYFVRDIMN